MKHKLIETYFNDLVSSEFESVTDKRQLYPYTYSDILSVLEWRYVWRHLICVAPSAPTPFIDTEDKQVSNLVTNEIQS